MQKVFFFRLLIPINSYILLRLTTKLIMKGGILMNDQIKVINAGSFGREVLESDIPVIVDFYSSDCPPCDVLSPIYDNLADKYSKQVKFIKILRENNKDFAKSLGIKSSPTILFYKSSKEVGSRLSGFIQKLQLRKSIEDFLGIVLPKESQKKVNCDILILGAGASGLSAAIYSARAKMSTIVLDESVLGGQTASTYHIGNYPGTPGLNQGKELISNIRKQSLSYGAIIEDLREITEVKLTNKIKLVSTEDTLYQAKTIIIASGAKPKTLLAESADEFKGRGVHYCATSDGPNYQNKRVVVVGDGCPALEESLFLTKFAAHVTIINPSDHFHCSTTAQEEILSNPKIEIIWDSDVTKVIGHGNWLTSIIVENIRTKEIMEIPTDGVFAYIGTEPMTKFLQGQVALDAHGYILASEDTKTSLEGVFAAGDIRSKPIRQVVTAVSDGAIAGIMAQKYITTTKFN